MLAVVQFKVYQQCNRRIARPRASDSFGLGMTCIYITYKLSCNVDVVGLPITLFVQQRLQTYKYPEPQDNLGLTSLRVGSQFFFYF